MYIWHYLHDQLLLLSSFKLLVDCKHIRMLFHYINLSSYTQMLATLLYYISSFSFSLHSLAMHATFTVRSLYLHYCIYALYMNTVQ